MKWLGVIVLVVVGALAAFVAVEYLTVSIHAVPSFLGPHKGRGHYRKRGAAAALVALIAFVAAGYLIFRNWKASKALAATTAAPAVPASPAPASVAPSPPPAQPLPTETSAANEQPTGE